MEYGFIQLYVVGENRIMICEGFFI